jgi:heme A synthase
LVRPAILLAGLVAAQIILGAWTVLSARDVAVNTAHVATGALVWVTAVVLALRAHRAWFPDAGPLGVRPGRVEPRERAPEVMVTGPRRTETGA